MKEKDDGFKIYNLLKKYQEIYNKNFLVITEKQKKLNFDVQFATFCHLIGLHYCNKDREKAKNIGKKILSEKLSDEKIFDMIKDTRIPKGLTYVERRINNIEYFLENLDKGIFVNSNNSENSKINSTNFILQTQDKKFLELGLVNKFEDEYYLETFLIRENDKNIDYTEKSKILEIYKEDTLLSISRFSFDLEKQKVLDEYKDLSYKECMDIYYNAELIEGKYKNYKSYYENGNVKAEGQINEIGKREGEWKFYKETGELETSKNYNNGVEISKSWNELKEKEGQSKDWGARATQKSGLGHGE